MFRTPLKAAAGKESGVVDVEDGDDRCRRKTFPKFVEGNEMRFCSGGFVRDAMAAGCRAAGKGAKSEGDQQKRQPCSMPKEQEPR